MCTGQDRRKGQGIGAAEDPGHPTAAEPLQNSTSGKRPMPDVLVSLLDCLLSSACMQNVERESSRGY